MKKNKIILSIICSLAACAFAAPDSLYIQAQKLYSMGNFEAAAKAYANSCPQLEAKEKKICLFNETRAMVESNKIDLVRATEEKLFSLISQTEPNDTLFTEMNVMDSKLQIMLNQPMQAIRSWNAAQASASTDYFPELFVVCRDIVSAFPKSEFTSENCDKIKPADTTLLSLSRKKITPLNISIAPVKETTTTTAKEEKSSKWFVQLGAYGNKENAEKLVADFKNRGVQLYVTELTDRKLFVVRTGLFESADAAKIYAEQKIAPTHKDYKIFQ
ncbi:MAG: SPOR domain-containing protein [Fibromonadales bacterium]|nr:SPOR domain-containing protein [Fibromonadales bacterium]